MKVWTPPIAWHNRDRVSTIDFQPVPYPKSTKDGGTRIATGGDDNHVIIWELVTDPETGKLEPQCICDVARHQNSVNAVRWSPDGKFLASADTDSAILILEYSETDAAPNIFDNDEETIATENWTQSGTLRGHLQDVIGLSWSPCSKFLISCSTDNTAIVFDVKKGTKVKMLDDHKGWVNGVSWDPLNKFVLTLSSDRHLRVYNTKNYKNKCKTYKSQLPVSIEDKENPGQFKVEERNVRLFHDDTFQSFYRRLDISPDGELIVVPSGVLEIDGEAAVKNCTYVFTRASMNKPVLYLPGKEISIAVRFNPIKFELRPVPRIQADVDPKADIEDNKPWTKYQTLFALPYRMVYAVATQNTVILYDTQQAEPFARVSKIHYVSLNDLAWSPDGSTLTVSSTDGYCSIIKFKDEELGKIYKSGNDNNDTDALKEMEEIEELEDLSMMDEDLDEDADEVPVSKEGIPLNKEGVCSPAEIKIRSLKEGGRPNPKRLQLITISSPKSSKEENLDENDLNLVLEEPTPSPKSEKNKKRVQLISLDKKNNTTDQIKNNSSSTSNSTNDSTAVAANKKRVPFVTLSK